MPGRVPAKMKNAPKKPHAIMELFPMCQMPAMSTNENISAMEASHLYASAAIVQLSDSSAESVMYFNAAVRLPVGHRMLD